MSDTGRIREQRDRFLAFSFAAADLLLEVDEKGVVAWALGAARGITGTNESALIGHPWLELFSEEDRPVLAALQSQAEPVRRCGPLLVTLGSSFGTEKKSVLTAIRMPGSNRLYVTLGFTSVLTMRIGEALNATHEALRGPDSFIRAAKDAMILARTLGQEIALTLLDVEGLSELRDRLGSDAAREIEQTIGSYLAGKSLDGQSAAMIAEGKFSLVHDLEMPAEPIRAHLARIAGDGLPLNIRHRTLPGDLEAMSDHEIDKALLYTIGEFERSGMDSPIRSLNTSFRDYLSTNTLKVGQLREFIEQLKFDILFQPVVDLKTYEAHHFEILSRFQAKGSTAEWLAFGEDVGLSTDFDAAVCERIINYLLYKSPGRRSRFAINLSPASLGNDKFLGDLITRVRKIPDLPTRMIFELSSLPETGKNDGLANFIKTAKTIGCEVGLDNFLPPYTALADLQKLSIDYVKFDGARIRKMLASGRDAAQIRDVIAQCKDLGIRTIAEIVETDEQAWRLRHMGMDLAQGFLFAPPRPKPEYTPPEKIPDSAAGHA